MPFPKSVSSIFLICKVSCKNRKDTYILGQKLLYLGSFGLNSKKSLSYFKSVPWTCLIAKFGAIIQFLKFGPYLGYFWVEIWKQFFHIWNQLSQICIIAKFCKKQKCLNLGPKMLILVFLGWNLKTIMSYLKPAPSNLSNCKVLWKNKNA